MISPLPASLLLTICLVPRATYELRRVYRPHKPILLHPEGIAASSAEGS